MRATNGIWAAVGAGTSLAAAALIALVSVSVVLAVHGWPQVGRSQNGSVALRAQMAAAVATGSGAAAAPAPTVVVPVAARPRRAAARRGPAGRGPAGRRPAARRPSGGSTPSTPVASTGGSGAASGG